MISTPLSSRCWCDGSIFFCVCLCVLVCVEGNTTAASPAVVESMWSVRERDREGKRVMREEAHTLHRKCSSRLHSLTSYVHFGAVVCAHLHLVCIVFEHHRALFVFVFLIPFLFAASRMFCFASTRFSRLLHISCSPIFFLMRG